MKEVELSEYSGNGDGEFYCAQIYHVDREGYVVAITSGGERRLEIFDRMRVVGSVSSLDDAVEENGDVKPLMIGGHLVVVDGESKPAVIDKREIKAVRDVS